MHPRDQTIYALSSGRPPSAIAIVRVSGPEAREALRIIAGKIPQPRVATRATLRDHAYQPIDDAIVLLFAGPASATGEDIAEIHIHGSRAVLATLIDALSRIPNMRAAEPGEFTRRAFENGKLDLTEAEGLDDLIHADTDRQRRQALLQLSGMLGDKARRWRESIVEAAALIEAGIDFSDEGDVPAELIAPAMAKIAALRDEIAEVLAAQARSERLRDGLVVAISGKPNVGKSTLINGLSRREVAIVSPHAGTTRDIIEVQLDLDGYPVTLIDTAGIRDTDDPVEQEGVRRARARARDADLVLWLVDEDDESGVDVGQAPVWIVRNKVDLDAKNVAAIVAANSRPDWGKAISADDLRPLAISAERGDGIADLVAALVRFAAETFGTDEAAIVTRERHRVLLGEAGQAFERALVEQGGDELIAEELRVAAQALGRLLGRVDVEDLLDVIFSKFCIGK